MKYLLLLLLLAVSFIMTSCKKEEKNTVVVGQEYVKDQQSETKNLKYDIPAEWESNDQQAKKYGIEAVLLPKGKTLETTDKAITIAFQKKDSSVPALSNLQEFYKADMMHTMQKFPDMKAQRWQPSQLDPTKINFMSLEITEHSAADPSPSRILFIGSGDGYYVITLTTSDIAELQDPKYEAFFNSIVLKDTGKI